MRNPPSLYIARRYNLRAAAILQTGISLSGCVAGRLAADGPPADPGRQKRRRARWRKKW